MVRLLLTTAALQAMVLQAQTELTETSLRHLWTTRVREVVAATIDLSGDSSGSFWKIYNEYEDTRVRLAVRKIQLIGDYLRNHDMTDEIPIDKLCREWLKNDLAYAKLKRKYYRQFRRAILPAEALLLFKLENDMEIYIGAYIINACLDRNLLLPG